MWGRRDPGCLVILQVGWLSLWGSVDPEFHVTCCCCSVTQLCLTCDAMDCSMPGFPLFHRLPELAQTHVYWVSDAIQPSHSLLSPFPPAFNLSQQRVFSNESALCIRWPKYWHFSISPSNEYSGLISFKIDWFDFLAVQGTLKSLESIISVALSLLYGLAVTPVYDYWKDHNLDCIDLSWQSDSFAF